MKMVLAVMISLSLRLILPFDLSIYDTGSPSGPGNGSGSRCRKDAATAAHFLPLRDQGTKGLPLPGTGQPQAQCTKGGTMPASTVLLTSSHELGWTDLRNALRSMEGVRVIGEATTAKQARRLAMAHSPDVILSALTVAGEATLPLLGELRRECCLTSKFLLFATHFDAGDLAALADLRPAGYLLWGDLTCESLRYCLGAVITGDIMVSSRAVGLAFIETQCGALLNGKDPLRLSARARAVLQGLANGLTRKEIALALRLSEPTVKRIVADLEARLDAPNPFALGMTAARLGLVRERRLAQQDHTSDDTNGSTR